jgi:hypothetical protein
MSILARPTDAPAAHCPTCGLDGEGVDRLRGKIHTANYLCPAGHIWQTRWADLEESA